MSITEFFESLFSRESVNTLDLKVYALEGHCYTRLTYGGNSENYLNRVNFDISKAFPLKGVEVYIYLKDENKPFETTSTDEEGRFLFNNLTMGEQYTLIARLENKAENLKEELSIKMIEVKEPASEISLKIDRLVLDRYKTTFYKKDKTKKDNEVKEAIIYEDSEDINGINLEYSNGISILNLKKNHSLIFNTFSLRVPYVNQRGITIAIEPIGPVIVWKNNEMKEFESFKKACEHYKLEGCEGNARTALESNGYEFKKFQAKKQGFTGNNNCCPSSAAMVCSYYNSINNEKKLPDTVQEVAEKTYFVWGKEHKFEKRALTYSHKPKPDKRGQLVWMYFKWLALMVKDLMGAENKTQHKDGLEELPQLGKWITHNEQVDIFDSDNYEIVRENIGRGWPLIIAVNIYRGHIVVVRGLVLKNDGSIHKFIVNDPWGNLSLIEKRKGHYAGLEHNLSPRVFTKKRNRLTTLKKNLVDISESLEKEIPQKRRKKLEEKKGKTEKKIEKLKKRLDLGTDIGKSSYYNKNVFKHPKKGENLKSRWFFVIRYGMNREMIQNKGLVYGDSA